MDSLMSVYITCTSKIFFILHTRMCKKYKLFPMSIQCLCVTATSPLLLPLEVRVNSGFLHFQVVVPTKTMTKTVFTHCVKLQRLLPPRGFWTWEVFCSNTLHTSVQFLNMGKSSNFRPHVLPLEKICELKCRLLAMLVAGRAVDQWGGEGPSLQRHEGRRRVNRAVPWAGAKF